MLMTVETLKKYIATDETDAMLEARLQALELGIRSYTNNRFHQFPPERIEADIRGGVVMSDHLIPFDVGDTVQVTYGSRAEDCGIYTVKEITGDTTFTVNEDIPDMDDVDVIKVKYPADVLMGAVNILKWQLKNEAANNGDTSKKDIQSETISRHSVTYVTDATEADIDMFFGVPKKTMAFLKRYKKARF